jgi:hypothetical protein
MKILGLLPDQGSAALTHMLVEAMNGAAECGMGLGYQPQCGVVELETLLSGKGFRPHNTDIPEGLREFVRQLQETDVMVLATPVHWFSPHHRFLQLFGCITGLESSKRPTLLGKTAAVLAHSHEDGAQQTVNTLGAILEHFGCGFAPNTKVWVCGDGAGAENDWQKQSPRIAGHNAALYWHRMSLASPPSGWAF